LDLNGGGLKATGSLGFFLVRIEKRGVHRLHENMLPGNSFPQICVVSESIMIDNGYPTQEYLGTMDESNHLFII
jgi:hypothetical protein